MGERTTDLAGMDAAGGHRRRRRAAALLAGCLWLPASLAGAAPPLIHAPLIFYRDAGAWHGAGPEMAVTVRGPEIGVGAGSGSLRVVYEGANREPRTNGCGAPAVTLNSIRGNQPARWKIGVAGYDCILVEQLYAGIDLRLSGPAGRLKSDYLVRPGSRPEWIAFRHLGALRTRVEEDGALVSDIAGGGQWRDERPYAYQESSRGRIEVDAAYEVGADGLIRFRLGRYDEGLPLVIDPVISFSTLLGMAGISSATAVAADSSGYVYVAGYADTAGMPLSGAQKSAPTGVDIYVAKLDPAAGRVIYATYLGGGWDDRAAAIAVDAQGNAYLAGSTTSPDFPLKQASQAALSGYRDAFLLKLDAAGGLAFSTYYGGTDADSAAALKISGATVWMAGDTSSLALPGTPGAQSTNSGLQDGFVAAFSTAGAPLTATFVGGVARDSVRALALGGDGTVYVGGLTESPSLMGAGGGFQQMLRGVQDGFIARLSGNLQSVLNSTYVGGTGGGGSAAETVAALAVDSLQNVYAAGTTPSPDFACVAGWVCTFGGQQDAFVLKASKDLSTLVWSTFLGGAGKDYANALVYEPAGALALAGSTTSPDFPVVAPLQAAYAGGSGDAFLARIAADGQAVTLATYLGGSGAEGAYALALGVDGALTLAGQSGSLNYPQVKAVQAPAGTALRMFVTRVTSSNLPSLDGVTAALGPGWAQTFTFTVSHPGGWNAIARMELLIASSTTATSTCRLLFHRDTNTLDLDDNGTWKPVHIGLPEWAANSNCLLYGKASSASTSGNALTISAVLQFGAGFTGTRNLYMNAAGWDNAATGYVQKGSWTVTTAANQWPSATAVSPASGGGASQVFRFTLTDRNGGSDITRSRYIFNTSLAEAGGCSILYEHLADYVMLAPDQGGGWLGGGQAGSSATLQNSYCRVNLAGTSSTVSGNDRIVNLDITFLPGFQGRKQIYALAADLSENGYAWLPVGEWNPTAGSVNQAPAWVWMLQSGASGPGVALVADFVDPEGAADIASLRLHIHSGLGTAGACSLRYDAASDAVYLLNDAGSAWLGPASPGSAAVLQNSQCRFAMTDVRASPFGSEMRLLAIPQFQSSFAGPKAIYLQATDKSGMASPWIQSGNFTAAATGPNHAPLATFMTPTSAIGSRQQFTLALADANGVSDINSAQILMNSYPFIQQGCYMLLYKPGNLVYLADDTGSNFAPVHLGASETARNSQCTLYGATSSVATSGNLILLTLDLSFTMAFESLRYFWANVTDQAGVTGPSPTLGQYGVVP
jgi:hypothetical protein